MLAVVALPIKLIVGLFGMNLAGRPLAEHPHGFWLVVALVACVTSLAFWLIGRRGRERP